MIRPLALLILLTLTACGGGKPPADLYVLRAPESLSLPAGKIRGSLIVERPSARAEYDTKRIAVMLDTHKLTYYTGANWASPLPDQLRSFLIDALLQSRQFTSVSDGNNGSEDSYRLQVTIHEASVIHASEPQVRLRLSGVIRSPQGHAAARFKIVKTVPAEANHMAEIVAAFNEAATQAARAIAAK